MTPFRRLQGIAVSMPAANIDTDQILPKQYLRVIRRDGLADALFYDDRYDIQGNLRKDSVFNNPPFNRAVALVAGSNFGCGSSREHAVWALLDFGVRCVIAPSFGEIFAANCAVNGVLAVVLPEALVGRLFAELEQARHVLIVDLPKQRITLPTGKGFQFDCDPRTKARLLKGHDRIDETLQFSPQIQAFESRHQAIGAQLLAAGKDRR